MDPDLAAGLREIIGGHVGVEPDHCTTPGSTIVRDDGQGTDGWVTLFTVDGHVIAEVPAPFADTVGAVLADRPDGHQLTEGDLAAAWPEQELEVERIPLSILYPPVFRPATPPRDATMRVLTGDDRAAFDAFHERCSPEDREEALVDIDHLAVGAVVDGAIVAVASTFDWCGFDDIGVLTDPDHRRHGLGAAAVSRLCSELIVRSRTGSYRYFEGNLASRALAASLGLVPIAPILRLRPR